MRKKYIFISDFDGTISKEDFYWRIINKYRKEEGNLLYKKWQNGEYKDIDFLSIIFNHINLPEDKIIEEILDIPFDETFISFSEYIAETNGELIVLSAGMRYYIDILFKNYHIKDVKVYSNEAYFKENGLYFNIDKAYKYYSDIYGIDKNLVVKDLIKDYGLSFYAGDSQPDYLASLNCEYRFATGKLVDIFKKEGNQYTTFSNFNDIKNFIKTSGLV